MIPAAGEDTTDPVKVEEVSAVPCPVTFHWPLRHAPQWPPASGPGRRRGRTSAIGGAERRGRRSRAAATTKPHKVRDVYLLQWSNRDSFLVITDTMEL